MRQEMEKWRVNTPEGWSEFQDRVEEWAGDFDGNQEPDVEVLESCVRSCKKSRFAYWRSDRWWDQQETFEACNEEATEKFQRETFDHSQHASALRGCGKAPIPCQDCFSKIPEIYRKNNA